MKRLFLWVTLLLAPSGLAHAQAPDVLAIQLAMNEGLELEFPAFQEFADVQVLRGGVTVEGDYLFLCSARLLWRLSSDEFAAIMQQEIDEAVPQEGGYEVQMLAQALANALAVKLGRIGAFATGDVVNDVRFRVRLEQAGADWIATESKIKESSRNPLTLFDEPDR